MNELPANLNFHVHTLVADGLWVRDEDGRLRFEPLRVDEEDVAAVVARVARRVRNVLIKRGILDEGGTQVRKLFAPS